MVALLGRNFLVMIVVLILWEELQLAIVDHLEEEMVKDNKKLFVNNAYLRKLQGIKPSIGDKNIC
tara:strand:- start:500 stop:694 length:195 start_codon:yes stop_codon:yes gene_type:complete